VRYLYNNWIALLAQPEDRERAKRGHHEASRKMAERIAKALSDGANCNAKLLAALTESIWRSGGYPMRAVTHALANDVETVKVLRGRRPRRGKGTHPFVVIAQPQNRNQAVIVAFTLRENSLDDCRCW